MASLSATSHFGCLQWLGKTHHNTYTSRTAESALSRIQNSNPLTNKVCTRLGCRKSRGTCALFFWDSHGLVWQPCGGAAGEQRLQETQGIAGSGRHGTTDHWGKQPLGNNLGTMHPSLAIFGYILGSPNQPDILFISYPFMVCSRWQRTTKLDKDPSGPSHGLFLWAQLSDSVHQNSYLSMVKQNCITHYTFLWHPQPTFLGLKSKNLFCLQDFKVKKTCIFRTTRKFGFPNFYP